MQSDNLAANGLTYKLFSYLLSLSPPLRINVADLTSCFLDVVSISLTDHTTSTRGLSTGGSIEPPGINSKFSRTPT